MVFTAYSIQSDYLSRGRCTTLVKSPIRVEPPFTVIENASIPTSDLYRLAGSSFADHLGFGQCGGVVISELVLVSNTSISSISTAITAKSVSPVESSSVSVRTKTETPSPTSPAAVTLTGKSGSDISSSTSSNAPAASGPKTSLGVGARIAIGVCVPVLIVTVFALAIRRILQHRKRKLMDQSNGTGTPLDGSQPYLQQKGELEAEEKRKYEVQAEERRYELADDNQIREMSTTDSPYELSIQRTQELRGEEHSRELG